MKLVWKLAVLCLAWSTAQANEVQVEFGVFDSAKEQGEKFEQALRKGVSVSSLVIKGRRVELGGDWQVFWSGYRVGGVTEAGSSLLSRQIADGYVMLGRQGKDQAFELLYLDMNISYRKRTEYFPSSPAYCLQDKKYLFQSLQADTTTKISCLAIQQSRMPETEQAWQADATATRGIAQLLREQRFFAPGSEVYEQEMFLSRNGSHFYAYRTKPVVAEGIEPFKRDALQLRDNVQQNFL